MLRGGIGAQSLGSTSSYGGRSYFYIFGAIIGYFALSAVRIPAAKANRAARIYFISGVTFLLVNLAFMLGPTFYFLYYLLPSEYLGSQVAAESGWMPGIIERFGGVPAASTALVCYFLLRWGLRGILSWAHPWRMALFLAAVLLSLEGGFRAAEVLFGLLVVCQFCCEGLWRTRFLALALGVGLAAGVALFSFSDRLPMAAQRAVSFLPVKVAPDVKADADYSAEWRFQMWGVLVPQIPKYLLLGKGYRIDPEELYLADLAVTRGEAMTSEFSMVAGEYHSGPLSTIIPLGLWGAIGFLWLLGAGVKVLYQNYRYGDPALHRINAFFLAFFIAQIILFFAVFGAFDSRLVIFTGLLGISVSINGGVRKPARIPARAAQQETVVAGSVPVHA